MSNGLRGAGRSGIPRRDASSAVLDNGTGLTGERSVLQATPPQHLRWRASRRKGGRRCLEEHLRPVLVRPRYSGSGRTTATAGRERRAQGLPVLPPQRPDHGCLRPSGRRQDHSCPPDGRGGSRAGPHGHLPDQGHPARSPGGACPRAIQVLRIVETRPGSANDNSAPPVALALPGQARAHLLHPPCPGGPRGRQPGWPGGRDCRGLPARAAGARLLHTASRGVLAASVLAKGLAEAA